ncbi:MAG: hypothetical protein RL327_626, partial [Pseudomonadota bacterium]
AFCENIFKNKNVSSMEIFFIIIVCGKDDLP